MKNYAEIQQEYIRISEEIHKRYILMKETENKTLIAFLCEDNSKDYIRLEILKWVLELQEVPAND